jgi:hypothetical protein
MKFPLARFRQFCDELVIDSKEQGQINLSSLMGTQEYHIEQVVRGLEEGVHYFVELKSRQLGITTIQLALDLFWHYEYPGMQGTLASDSEDNKHMFRSTLSMFHNGLPKSHRLKLVSNNRDFLEWVNRSRIFMQIGGGVKRKGGKGRGKGIIFMHATECSSWEDEESLASIISSLAEINPLRLAVFESTARGFNMFQEMYAEAKDAVTQRAIFNGWWRNQFYRKEKDSNEYKVYWDGNLTGPEREWVQAVKQAYDYEVSPEQIAWWRWKLAEGVHDENYMMQEFPPTEELAFILTGKNFFTLSRVHEIAQEIEAEEPPLESLRFEFGDDFMKTKVQSSPEKTAQLRIWEQPEDSAFYVIGADPAYGSATWADRSVVEVYRCYADRFEQVAEFCTAEITTYKFAWVICYLAGAYKNSMVNVELNGPGEAVLGEIDNLRRQASMLGSAPTAKALRDVIGNIKYFLYRKLDSPFGGAVYHWKTTTETKDRAFNAFRDIMEKGFGVIHSEILVEEMKIIVREADGFLGASGRGKDDCTVASAIASEPYARYFVSKLKQMGITWAKECERRHKIETVGRADTPVESAIRRSVGGYLDSIGIKYGVAEE